MTDFEGKNSSSGVSFSDLVQNSAGDAGASNDSAIQYLAFDLLEAGIENQEGHLSELEDSVEETAGYVFPDGVRVAAQHGEHHAAKWTIEQILEEVDTDSAVGKRFEERLRQKEGHIAQAYDSALTKAKRAAKRELNEVVIDWGEVV